MTNQPNAEQLLALRDYAAEVGPKWKERLSTDWMRGGTRVYGFSERYHLLHQVRNQFGPSWLQSFDPKA